MMEHQGSVMFRSAFVALLLGGGAACKRPLTPEEDRARALEIVRTRASADELNGCPADVVPARKATKTGDFNIYCDKRHSWCAEQCFGSDVMACYSLALAIQKDKVAGEWEEPLFYRACALGDMSGCTNRAAGFEVQHPSDEKALHCAARTYENTCVHGDPWGCTIHGIHLMEGKLMKQDLKKARTVLGRSCKYGSEDPACQTARNVLSQLDAYEKEHGETPSPARAEPPGRGEALDLPGQRLSH